MQNKPLDQAVRDGFTLAHNLVKEILANNKDDPSYGLTMVKSILQCLVFKLADADSKEEVDRLVNVVLDGPEFKQNIKEYLN